MLTKQDKLLVFEDFHKDPNLPKFSVRRAHVSYQMSPRIEAQTSGFVTQDRMAPVAFRSVLRESENFGAQAAEDWHERKKKRKSKGLFGWLKEKLMPERVPEEPTPTLTIPEFFASMKNSAKELAIVEERAKGYELAIENAVKAGQIALAEQLVAGLNAARSETQLVAMNLPKFIEEEALVSFVKKCPRGLRLDWISNFTRVIPPRVLEVKQRADDVSAFDNYLVLHFDPEAKSYQETQAQKEARKDPVLFGVMEGRRRLYFVGDWIDEVCDLSFDQIADLLGHDLIGSLEKAEPESPFRTP